MKYFINAIKIVLFLIACMFLLFTPMGIGVYLYGLIGALFGIVPGLILIFMFIPWIGDKNIL